MVRAVSGMVRRDGSGAACRARAGQSHGSGLPGKGVAVRTGKQTNSERGAYVTGYTWLVPRLAQALRLARASELSAARRQRTASSTKYAASC